MQRWGSRAGKGEMNRKEKGRENKVEVRRERNRDLLVEVGNLIKMSISTLHPSSLSTSPAHVLVKEHIKAHCIQDLQPTELLLLHLLLLTSSVAVLISALLLYIQSAPHCLISPG